jgi:hypothetical protein
MAMLDKVDKKRNNRPRSGQQNFYYGDSEED